MTPLLTILDEDLRRGYANLGDGWDRSFSQCMRELQFADELERRKFRDAISKKRAWPLVGFARRFSVWAVRVGDSGPLEVAFAALAFADPSVIDARDVERVRALLFRSVEILGQRPEPLICRASEMTDEAGKAWLFAKVEPHATPQEMAFEEIGSGETFRYESTMREADLDELRDLLDDDHHDR